METSLILALAAGLFSYWIVKIKSEINGPSPVTDFKGFMQAYAANIALSFIGLCLVVLNGPSLNFTFGDFHLNLGNIDGPIPAFIVGGGIPSMMNNITGAFKKQ